MMELIDQSLQERQAWEAKNYVLPEYDRQEVRQVTMKVPQWIHFGGGNIFRAFQAPLVDKLLSEEIMDRGIIVAASRDQAVIDQVYRAHDDLTIAVTLCPDGKMKKRVVGSMMESLALDMSEAHSAERLRAIFTSESLQLATFTITEKGYNLQGADGKLLPDVQQDIDRGPGQTVTYMGIIAELLYCRYTAGQLPLALVSMDNVSHNGDRLQAAIMTLAQGWTVNGKAEAGFLAYVTGGRVSFPWSMIDKITPRPSATVEKMLQSDGIEGLAPFVTKHGSYVASYVNAEEKEYLVIEDDFPNGRPALEKGGIIFTDRETVERAEKMKVSCCLNPLHTALAIFGCLLSYDRIYKEMHDDDLVALVRGLGYGEGLPVVESPGILDPRTFMDTCIEERFSNPFLPDTPQRIATDTSQKLSVRFGQTVRAYLSRGETDKLNLIPLVYAGWLRYLLAVDDRGQQMELSSDPLLDEICPIVQQLSLGCNRTVESVLAPVLHREDIFGIDLYEAGLAVKVCRYFQELITGPGAVRRTLYKYVKTMQ